MRLLDQPARSLKASSARLFGTHIIVASHGHGDTVVAGVEIDGGVGGEVGIAIGSQAEQAAEGRT